MEKQITTILNSKPPTPEIFSIRTGVLISSQRAVFLTNDDALAEENVAHTYVFQWNHESCTHKWNATVFPWTAKSVCLAQQPEKRVIAIGDWGEFISWRDENGFEGSFEGQIRKGDKKGPFRSVKRVGDLVYAVGMGGLIYRQDGSNQWTQLGLNIPPKIHFESISAFSPEEIYVVGGEGEIWYFDGNNWSRVNSPTNVILTNVCCAGDGNVYCTGTRGVLIRGRKHVWNVIEHGDTKQDLWDVHWFDNRLWLTTITFLYTLENGASLKRVSFGEEVALSCYHLTSADNMLLSIGMKDILAYRNGNWTRIF